MSIHAIKTTKVLILKLCVKNIILTLVKLSVLLCELFITT